MRHRGRTWLVLVGVVALGLTITVALVSTGALERGTGDDVSAQDGAGQPEQGPPASVDGTATAPATAAPTAPAAFLQDWVNADGRVVRRDQGDDTVSEGQAYGLLIALGVRDEDRFDTIWSWTKENLMRPDGLLAWRWNEGGIVDAQPASDADLDTAQALVHAGTVFDRPDLRTAGRTLAKNILDRLTVQTPAGRILLPGLWAKHGPDYYYNPSYASPAAFDLLARSTGDPRWSELQQGSRNVTVALLQESPLPPDWAQVDSRGQVHAMPTPRGSREDVRYSYDAARLPVRYAQSCDAQDRELAARLLPVLSRTDPLPAVLNLGGAPQTKDQHPIAYIGRAAAADAADKPARMRANLDTAEELSSQFQTYYGAAWTSLGRLFLDGDALDSCGSEEDQ